jgi:hypothetical protein
MTRARISTLALGVVLGVLAAAVSLPGSATAQKRTKEKLGFAVTGEITAIDPAAKSITVKSTNDEGVTYQVADSATILSGSKHLTLADLKKGWSVAMNGQRHGDAHTATMIKVVKAP